MLLLALDTSTRQSSIALCSEDELYGEITWYAGSNHSVELLTNIQRLFTECQMALSQIDAVAVETGPGSFNGVRVALATAKALTFALNKALVGVSTLDVIAAQQQQWHGPICSVLEAGRSELYAACYQSEIQSSESGNLHYHLRQLSDYLMYTPQHLIEHLREQANDWFGVPGERQFPPFLFCGEMNTNSRQILRAQMQEKGLESYFIDSIQAARRASVLARLALERLQADAVDDPLVLEPLYLRRPSITTSTRKQPLLGNTSQRNTGQSKTEREEGALRH
jgi:tRNA threonylcarbamoyladenosine biosynthesis protein TsaB